MFIQIIDAAWFWGLIGSVLFTGILILHHIWGPGPKVRDENGKRQPIAPEYRTFVAIEMIALVSLLVACSTIAVNQFESENPGIVSELAVAYFVLFIINLWDLVVIDWALVVRFRPKLLILPDTVYFNTMKPHFMGWLAGNLYMLPFAGIAYLISIWV